MDDWKSVVILSTATISEAVRVLDATVPKICLIVEPDNRLKGTITDGDIRRGLLNGLDMDSPVEMVMNRNPLAASPETEQEELRQMMKTAVVNQIPLVDGGKKVVGLVHIGELTEPIKPRNNWVVLMAGGMGKRLRPLTESTPKPLLTVGEKPLLQTILESFAEQNFEKFFISVNYKADDIKRFFGDGREWNVEIHYLEEEKHLGTVGAVRLLPDPPEDPVIVMNGDLITRINFQDLLDYHHQQQSKATMCVREYDFQVPFGVVEIDGDCIKTINEKPVHRFFINAGIYVLDPELISLIPDDDGYDMTELFETAIAAGKPTAVFPIHEYWVDVGRMDDLNLANLEYLEAKKS